MTLRAGCAFGLLALFSSSFAHAQVSLETIAYTGMPVFGMPIGWQFYDFPCVTLDDSGRVGFVGFVTNNPGAGVPLTSGAWHKTNTGSLTAIIKPQDSVVGFPAGTTFNTAAFNAGGSRFGLLQLSYGRFTYSGQAVGAPLTAADNTGIWYGYQGSVNFIARAGQTAPGTAVPFAQMKFNSFYATEYSGGRVMFKADAGASPNLISGTWLGGGANAPLAITGMAAPTAGYTWADSLPAGFFTDGRAVVTGRITNGTGNKDGIWAETQLDGVLHPVAAIGDPAPGTAVATTGQSPVLVRGYGVVFSAPLGTPPIPPVSSNAAVITGQPGALVTLARSGDALPGSPGVQMEIGNGSFSPVPGLSLAAGGAVGFDVRMVGGGHTSTLDRAIVMGLPGQLTTLVKTGDVLPGMTGGVHVTAVGSAKINDAGQVLVGLSVGTTFATSHTEIRAWHPVTGWWLLASSADPITVSPGNDRRFRDTVPFHNIPAITAVLGADGHVALGLLMDDNSWAVLRTRIPGSCAADVGRQGGLPGPDGFLDNNDFVVFIDLFFASDPRADVGAQGGVRSQDGNFDTNDFVVFIDLFFSEC